jgi:hypothetical protein
VGSHRQKFEAATQDDAPPSLRQLVRQFVLGCGYLFFASGIVAAVSAEFISTFAPQPPPWWPLFARTLVVMVAGTLLIVLVLLVWLARWSTARQVRRRQFGLVSVFLTMALLAAYLALVRWLAAAIWPVEPPLRGLAAIASVAFVVHLAGFVPLLCWTHSLVWFAARLVRTPFAQRWLFGRRRSSSE